MKEFSKIKNWLWALMLMVSQNSFAELPTYLWKSTATHNGAIFAPIVFNQDNSLVISASEDKTIKIWRGSDGALLRTLSGHTAPIRSLAISPDGTEIASGTVYDGTVRRWRVDNGALIATIAATFTGKGKSKTANPVNALDYSRDGNYFAAGVANSIIIRNRAGALVKSIALGNAAIAIRFSPDGKFIASVDQSGMARLWRLDGSLQSEKSYRELMVIFSMDISSDGSKMAIGAYGLSQIWNLLDSNLSFGMSEYEKAMRVNFSPNGVCLLSSNFTGGGLPPYATNPANPPTFTFRDPNTGRTLAKYEESSQAPFPSFSRDGKSFAYGRVDGSVVLARSPAECGN